MAEQSEKIDVENVNVPGQVTRVNADKYHAMRQAYLSVLPDKSPGMTQNALLDAVKSSLPEALFPGGSTSGWWMKTVQLDLEAKGLVWRLKTRPLTWHKTE